MTIDPVVQVLTVLISSSVGGFIGLYGSRRKNKAETGGIIQVTTDNVLKMVNAEITRLMEREQQRIQREGQLEEEINKLQRREVQNNMTIAALGVELSLVRNLLDQVSPNRPKLKVFVIDDYQYVLEVLKVQLSKISLIEVKTFDHYSEFVTALTAQPEIVIIDYHLDGKHTANDILDVMEKMKDYRPKIIIMSGHNQDEIRAKIAPRDVWRIFNKDGTYVVEIHSTIMQYIKNQSI